MICRACGGVIQQFLSLGDQPLPNRFLSRDQLGLPEPRYPLELYFCPGCTLVQLGTVVPPEDLFTHSLFASSTSASTRRHFSDLAAHLKKDFQLGPDVKVVDIASNDGILLRAWRDLGVSAIGVEPAANLCRLAWADGLETLNEFLTRETVGKIGPGSAHLVTAVNVLAHVPEIREFAENVRNLLHPEGIFVAEVQYLADMVTSGQFDNIYSEHVFYFTLTSLERLLAISGLRVFAAARVDTHGGSLRVYADKSFYLGSPASLRIKHEEQKLGLDRLETYQEFAKEVRGGRRDIVELLQSLRAEGKVIAAFGAPAKASTILNFLSIDPATIQYIVDDSPLKQGRYLPGVHIPIHHPNVLVENRPDILIILAWNFQREIRLKTEYLAQQGMKYLILLPSPRVI